MALQDLTPQLRTRLRKVEWFVVLFLGGTFVLMLASLAWFIKKTGDARGWWVTEVPYYTYLPDASGIKAGSPVHMMGFKIGQVTKVEAMELAQLRSWDYYDQHPVFVSFVVREPYPGYITSDSKLKLTGLPIDIAGGVTLQVTVGSPDGLHTTSYTNGAISVLSDKVSYAAQAAEQAKKPLTNLSAYANYTPLAKADKGFWLRLHEGDTLMAQVQRILGKVDGITGTFNTALPGLTNDLQHTLANVRGLTANLKSATAHAGGVGELVLGTNVMSRLDRPGGVGELVVPTNLNAELTATLAGVRTTVPGAISNLNERTASLGQLLTNLNGGTAHLGGLVTNLDETLDGVKTNAVPKVGNLLVTLDSFVAGLKRHWLFRSAFREPKTNTVPTTPSTNPPPAAASRRKF
jgi:MlaD protein